MDGFVKKIWDRKAVKYCVLAILAAMALVSLIQGIRNAAQAGQDFQWDAAKALSMRLDPYELSYDTEKALEYPPLAEFYRMFTDKGLKQKMEANQFPSLLMLLIPYTFLPPLAARYAWIISNLIFTAGIIFLLRRTFLKDADRDVFILFMLLMIAGTPYRNQLGVGQHTLFSFFFFLLAVWCEGMYLSPGKEADKKDRAIYKRKPGLFIIVVFSLFICYFKYTLTVPLCLYFVYKKRYLEIALSAGMHVILTVVSAVWLNDSFINMLVKPLKVSSALAAEGGLDFGALLNGSPAAYVLAFIVMALLFVMAFYLSNTEAKRNAGTEEAVSDSYGSYGREFLSVLILWSLILTYHRTYDFFVIVTVLAYFAGNRHGSSLSFLKILYAVVLIAVFFGLRVFSESTPSKIAAGIIYYLFTICVTIGTVLLATPRGSDEQ